MTEGAAGQAWRMLEEVRRSDQAVVAALTTDPEAFELLWHALARYAAAPGDHANALQGAVADSGWPPARAERLLLPVRDRLAAQGAADRAQFEAAAAAVGLEVHELLALALRRMERERAAAKVRAFGAGAAAGSARASPTRLR